MNNLALGAKLVHNALTGADDNWQSLVDAGIEARTAQDGFRWTLGDIAGKAESRYGEESIAKLAGEIGVTKAKTLYDYWRVSKFYPVSARAEFPALTWSHYRAAVDAVSLDRAMALLEQAEARSQTVADLDREIKKLSNPLAVDSITVHALCYILPGFKDAVSELRDSDLIEIRIYPAVSK